MHTSNHFNILAEILAANNFLEDMMGFFQPWFVSMLSIFVLIGYVVTLAINAKRTWVHAYNKPIAIFLLVFFGLAAWTQFTLYPWHISWGGIITHIVFLVVSLVFLFGGGLLVSDDVDPQKGVIVVRANSWTNKVMKALGVDHNSPSLCEASWTTILALFFVPVLSVVTVLAALIVFVGQIFISGDSPIRMAKELISDSKLFATWKYRVIFKVIPISPALWAIIGTVSYMAWIIHSDIYFQIIVGSALFAMVASYIIVGTIQMLLDKHEGQRGAYYYYSGVYDVPDKFSTDPIGYVNTLTATWKNIICPKLEIQAKGEVEARSEADESRTTQCAEASQKPTKMLRNRKRKLRQRIDVSRNGIR